MIWNLKRKKRTNKQWERKSMMLNKKRQGCRKKEKRYFSCPIFMGDFFSPKLDKYTLTWLDV